MGWGGGVKDLLRFGELFFRSRGYLNRCCDTAYQMLIARLGR
ncbi:MAG: hypothetical protein JWS11_3565, partial [Cypionkella sp.]|nr:hypothetical protein [Cypionkella sp.]